MIAPVANIFPGPSGHLSMKFIRTNGVGKESQCNAYTNDCILQASSIGLSNFNQFSFDYREATLIEDPDIVISTPAYSTASCQSGAYKQPISAAQADAANDNIVLSPNPANDIINLDFMNPITTDNVYVVITNILGQVQYQTKLSKGVQHASINLSSLVPGIYFAKITMNENIHTKKFIVK
ncbi:MAG: T9SS type A sorting domain-containing protein [Flavipsychrobacter sp.]